MLKGKDERIWENFGYRDWIDMLIPIWREVGLFVWYHSGQCYLIKICMPHTWLWFLINLTNINFSNLLFHPVYLKCFHFNMQPIFILVINLQSHCVLYTAGTPQFSHISWYLEAAFDHRLWYWTVQVQEFEEQDLYHSLGTLAALNS